MYTVGRAWFGDCTKCACSGLHVVAAERAARSQGGPAAGGARSRAGKAAGAGAGAVGDQVQFRSSHVRKHANYPSEASPLFKLLPDDFSPYWLRTSTLSRFLDRVALLCIAEVSVHAVHLAMVLKTHLCRNATHTHTHTNTTAHH